MNNAETLKMTTAPAFEQFKPAWWLPEGHTQTLWRKFGPGATVRQRRQRIELADGDFIDMDWSGPEPNSGNAHIPIVIIVHGLCGCSRSSYVLSLQSLLTENHISSAAMNFRGCSGPVNRLAKAYHSGVSADLDEVVARLREGYPRHFFALAGYSLGANVLLKWLGEGRDHRAVKCAVAVSTPFSLAHCSRAMLRGLSRVYGRYFVQKLKKDLYRKIRHLGGRGLDDELEKLKSLGDVQPIRTIWEFDDRVTAPLHGFKDAEHYYEQSSSRQFLTAISIDTLLIQSRNDPLIPPVSLPDHGSLPDNISYHLNEQGGHVGFIAGYRDEWLDRRIMNFALA